MIKVSPTDLLSASDPLLDVRSPGEYQAGHIPGAHCLPLFDDKERAQVGTSYKQKGQQVAIKLGLDIVGPKMRSFIERAEDLGSATLNLYCWRGGMRSESMGWLFERYGFEVRVLEGGYKAFRRQIHHYFERPHPIKVLTGYTGSAKTEVLHEMARKGAQVIDLERLANHQGSSFGNQLSPFQPTTEQFQNELFTAFLQLDQNRSIWLEDESICIGKVNLPEALFEQMSSAQHFKLSMPRSRRIQHLMAAYGKLEIDQLVAATVAIRKKLGPGPAEEAIALLKNGHLAQAADIILDYYDRQYRKSIDKKHALIRATIDGDERPISEIAQNLIEKECQLS